jgi:hypothetical protein
VEHGARLLRAEACEIVGGVREAACAGLLRDFFLARR